MGQSCLNSRITSTGITMKSLIILLVCVLALNALCSGLFSTCEKYEKANRNLDACAVLFDENCCKDSDSHYVIPKRPGGVEGKLCGKLRQFNPLSSCVGDVRGDDVEAVYVLPGCTLEVWDEADGLKDAKAAEARGRNEGDIKDSKDRYDQEKLVVTAYDKPNWIEELNDDFRDLNEDISSFRCRCN